MQPDFDHF